MPVTHAVAPTCCASFSQSSPLGAKDPCDWHCSQGLSAVSPRPAENPLTAPPTPAQDFHKFLADDQELLHASKAHWILVPLPAAMKREDRGEVDTCDIDAPGCNDAYLRIAMPEGSMQIGGKDVAVGSSQSSEVHVACSQVAPSAPYCTPALHACLPALLAAFEV